MGYDVFISFRGEDTRTGFTSHLYDALTRKHIRTYKDDKSLEIGSFIAPELLRAIEASKFAVVVLSSNFATSKWCLEEIAKIVDCEEKGKLIIIPVFYHVDPSDVRRQRNCFKQGFDSHEANREITPHKVKVWRSAFVKVAAIVGYNVTRHSNESDIVTQIVRKVLTGKQHILPSSSNNDLVGIESRVEDVKRMLSVEYSRDILLIGICGMSGVGKTTLAEAVYDDIQNQFEGSSFIENIKDVSKENDCSSLCKLQQKLLDDILKDEAVLVQTVKHGQTLLKAKLCDLKVLIVLDDVNHADQLSYLIGGGEWFGLGTRIIVTTTNQDLLNPYKMINEIYTCQELNDDEALKLFCKSAFKEGHPTHVFEKLSNDIVKLAGGLPLALKVYASIVCGKENKYWNEILKKLQEYPHKEVLGRLELGYSRLDRDQQNTFMYIACFLKGKDIDLVKDILSSIGLYPECGVPDLINKFLLTIKPDDSVWMHDLLQQMCWEILRKESHIHNGKQIAVKSRDDILDILSSKPKGMRTIEIINQEPYKVDMDDCFDDPTCFSKMTKLKFLRLSNIQLPQGLYYLSCDLRILEWHGCCLKSLPASFKPKHIFELDMCYSRLQTLWETNLDLPNLRSINLSFSKDLAKIADLSSAPNLVKLNLEGCTQLAALHESVLLHKTIRYMNLKGCVLLQSLGRSNMEMEALEILDLSGCSNLELIPEFGQNMRGLEELYVDGTNIKKLPESLGEMFNLRKLDASKTAIEEIPSSVHHLKRLRLLSANRCKLISSQTGGFLYANLHSISFIRELNLSYCGLSAVPDGIGLLYRLVNLDLSGNDFVSLPATVSLLSNLRMLFLNDCKRMQLLPKLSIVNEDTRYGVQIRFNYCISRKGIVDVSNFHATRNYTNPTISCLNCPKLVENECGGYIAEQILNNYLQLRSKYWITPEAVFEIIGAGSQIPSRFSPLKSNRNLIFVGQWIGVAICAVVAVHNIDAYMEAKYVVTAHIHLEETHCKIPVPVNFLVAGLENQLVFYWTVADDLQRTLDPMQIKNLSFSFSVEPEDGNVQVTDFGVCVIRDQNILRLKQVEYSVVKRVNNAFRATIFHSTNMPWYMCACEADTDLIIHDLTSSIIKFIIGYRKQQDSLDDIHQVIKRLTEVNQKILCECREEWRHVQLFPLIYDYYQISLWASELYIDFVSLLKDVSESWLSVKLALEQIVVKKRAADDYTYAEMLQQLIDLEAAESVKLSDNFVLSLAYICKQTVYFSKHLNEEQIQGHKKLKSLRVLAKVSCVTIAGVISVVAAYMGDSELFLEMKDITSYSMLWHVMDSFSRKNDEWFKAREQVLHVEKCDRELQIWEFYGCSVLLKGLKIKMPQFTSFTNEIEAEMIILIDKLDKKLDKLSVSINDMQIHADRYSLGIREARIMILNPAVFPEGNLQLTATIQSLKRHEDSVSEAMSILHRATSLSLDNGTDTVIHDHTSDILEFDFSYGKKHDFLTGMRKMFKCLHEIDQEDVILSSEFKHESTYLQLLFPDDNSSHIATEVYDDFVMLLDNVSDYWLRLKLELEKLEFKCRAADDYTNNDMLWQVLRLEVTVPFHSSYSIFVDLFMTVCVEGKKFLEIVNEKNFKSENVFGTKKSMIKVAGIFGVMATYLGDAEVLLELIDITSNYKLIDLIQSLLRKGGKWFDEAGNLRKTSHGVVSQIRDFYGNQLLHNMILFAFDTCIEEETSILIDKLDKNIGIFSEAINDIKTRNFSMTSSNVVIPFKRLKRL